MLNILITILLSLGIIQSTTDFEQLNTPQQQEYLEEYEEVIIDIVGGMEDEN